MELVVAGLALALLVAISIASSLAYQRSRWQKAHAILKEEHEKLKKASKEPTYDCRELLHDLTQGAGLVKIIPISSSDIWIKRS